eukprot:TRINITY_DN1548_c0_g1_i2.p1 TRINITY_DN1548_c0_g1~~TRINITY_DN1548_c0_g1_i2.p1  ORF type:complete len:200 (-),score=64.83 TRINITY_DN1548_c0_g1_i2:436-1035(-)
MANATPQQLLERAEGHIDNFEWFLAEKFLRKALSKDPKFSKAMDCLSQVLIETGDIAGAKEMLKKSIEVAPEEDFNKYMNLGQITGGDDAIQCYKKGIWIMLKIKQQTQNNISRNTPLDLQLCQAYCSLGEMYLTDACYDDNAEKECHDSLQEALKHNPQSAEAYYLLASMRISQKMNPDALFFNKKILSTLARTNGSY